MRMPQDSTVLNKKYPPIHNKPGTIDSASGIGSVRRYRKVCSFLLLILLIVTLWVPGVGAEEPPPPLFFSEYIEGSSNNKALEIYNPSDAAIDLAAGGYRIQMYFNGATTVGLTVNLTGTIPSNGTYVLAHASSSPIILAIANQTSTSAFYNGDDAVLLLRGTVVLDSIGQVGVDPGTEWGTGLTSTMDNTLVRKPSVSSGDTNPIDVFDPALEWTGYAVDTFTYLGSHDILLNQYTITFNTNGGVGGTSGLMNAGAPLSAPTVTRTGHTFANWLPEVPATVPAENTIYTAQWTVNQYTVSFDSAGGSAVANITQDYGTAVTAPADPTRASYTFAGWLPTVPGTMPASDTTCVAQWTYVLPQGPVVFYHIYGGGGNINGVYRNDFVVLRNIGSSPVNLDGWSINYNSYNGTEWKLHGTLSGFICPGAYYVIKAWYGDNTVLQAEMPYYHASLPELGIHQREYRMQLLDENAAVVDFIGSGAAIEFLGNGPAPFTENTANHPDRNRQSLIRNTAASNPYSGNNNLDYIIQSPTSLDYLLTDQVYNVSFDRNTGDTDSVPASLSVRHGDTLSGLPAEPAKANHQFTGWNTAADGSGAAFDLSYTVTSCLRVYAQWVPVPISGLPGRHTMFVGTQVSFSPRPSGGTWKWESNYLALSPEKPAARSSSKTDAPTSGNTATFSALRKGDTVVSYETNGVSHSINVTILPVAPPPPATGDDGVNGFTAGLLLLLLGSTLIIARLYRRRTGKRRQNAGADGY